MSSPRALVRSVQNAKLDLEGLLEIRRALDQRLEKQRSSLAATMRTIDGALAIPPGGKASVARALLGGLRTPGSRKARSGTKPPGRHEGLSVADSVRKVIGSKGGKASAGEIKEAFARAGDKRVLNFTILVNTGILKRAGDAPRIKGRRGRAGCMYTVA